MGEPDFEQDEVRLLGMGTATLMTIRIAIMSSMSIFAILLFVGRGNSADSPEPQQGYFGEPIDAYDATSQTNHISGLLFFSRNWTRADGVGARFNNHSCAGCHAIPMPGGGGLTADTFVLMHPNTGDVTGGHTFQRFHRLDDGTETRADPPNEATRRKTPMLFGAGLLEAVPLAEFDHPAIGPDQIRGRLGGSGETAGRFGWKARFADLRSFDTAAFAVEIGLGTRQYLSGPVAPEGDQAIDAVTEFIRHLDAPPRKLPITAAAKHGEALFTSVGCDQCHFMTLKLSPLSPLASKRPAIHPYSDLLLHDMGADLADGITEGRAGPRDFRTPPLWGLTSSGPPYLHDGRAPSIEAAILAHEGEAAPARQRYESLIEGDRGSLIEFLKSL